MEAHYLLGCVYRDLSDAPNKRTCHSSLCHLTFLNDSLIDKTYQKGFYKDRVLVNVNGKGEWY
jgi:hypothetical protein